MGLIAPSLQSLIDARRFSQSVSLGTTLSNLLLRLLFKFRSMTNEPPGVVGIEHRLCFIFAYQPHGAQRPLRCARRWPPPTNVAPSADGRYRAERG